MIAGVFEQALANGDGMVVSPAGKLPCPFFKGNSTNLAEFPLRMQKYPWFCVAHSAIFARSNRVSGATAHPQQLCRCT